MSRAEGGKARKVSGWCGMPLRAVLQHRGCPLDFGGGSHEEWQCECECHEEGYVEPVKVVAEPTPGYAIPRGYTTPAKSATRTNDRKPTQSGVTPVGTHWTTGGGGKTNSRKGLGWVSYAPEKPKTLEDIIAGREARSKK